VALKSIQKKGKKGRNIRSRCNSCLLSPPGPRHMAWQKLDTARVFLSPPLHKHHWTRLRSCILISRNHAAGLLTAEHLNGCHSPLMTWMGCSSPLITWMGCSSLPSTWAAGSHCWTPTRVPLAAHYLNGVLLTAEHLTGCHSPLIT